MKSSQTTAIGLSLVFIALIALDIAIIRYGVPDRVVLYLGIGATVKLAAALYTAGKGFNLFR